MKNAEEAHNNLLSKYFRLFFELIDIAQLKQDFIYFL